MKVLHCYKTYRPDNSGGVGSAIATLTDRVVMKGINSEILVARNRGWTKRYFVDGVLVEAVASLFSFFSVPFAPTYPFTFLRRAKECDIVVHHMPFPIVDLAICLLRKNCALIVYWHAEIVGRPFLKKLVTGFIRRTLRRSDIIIVSSSVNLESSEPLSDFRDKCVAVPFGIDVKYWSTCSAEETRLSEDLRKKYPRMIVSAGRLVKYKGYSVLLRAMRSVEGHLIIIGDGPLNVELRKQAEEYGVSQKVTFVGFLSTSQMKAYFHAAGVLAFPSISSAEAFGIVQLEAMAAGLPIVNSGLNTGVPHVARHNLESLTVPANDDFALANALTRILDDPSLADRLGKSGQIRACTEYSQETYVARIREIYEKVLENKAQSALPESTLPESTLPACLRSRRESLLELVRR